MSGVSPANTTIDSKTRHPLDIIDTFCPPGRNGYRSKWRTSGDQANRKHIYLERQTNSPCTSSIDTSEGVQAFRAEPHRHRWSSVRRRLSDGSRIHIKLGETCGPTRSKRTTHAFDADRRKTKDVSKFAQVAGPLCCAAIIGALNQGCLGVEPQDSASNNQVESSKNAIMLSGAKWPGGTIPVCWDAATVARSDFASLAPQVRNLANASWSAIANVDFTGWGTCPASTQTTVRVALNDSQGANASLGYSNAPVVNLGVNRADFFGGLIPHEFGHILGFEHEMARADFVDDASGDCNGDNAAGEYLSTPADRQSVMASTGYCQLNTVLSPWDMIGVINAYGPRTNIVSPLVTAWSTVRGDHATVATPAALAAINTAGYAWAYPEGWVFNSQIQGTVPLKLYWNAAREDNFSTATSEGEAAAIAGGYGFVRTEGYVFADPQPGTVAVKSFWSEARHDNLLTTSYTGEQIALDAGYTFVRVEGYVPSDVPYSLGWKFWSASLTDNLLTSASSGLSATTSAQYGFSGLDGATWKFQFPGTAQVETYHSSARSDYFTLATSASRSTAIGAGYALASTDGFVHTTAQPGEVAMKSYWRSSRLDNFTTVGHHALATGQGYSLTRTEGFAIPINE